MSRNSIIFIILLFVVSIFSQATLGKGKRINTNKTKTSTKSLYYAKISHCRVLDTIVKSIKQSQINESWFDWDKDSYIYTWIRYEIPTDTIYYETKSPNGYPTIGLVTILSDNDLVSMFHGEKVSRDILMSVFTTPSLLDEIILNYKGYNFELCNYKYEDLESAYDFRKKTFTSISRGLEFIEQPVITIKYKPSGDIEVLPVKTEEFSRF